MRWPVRGFGVAVRMVFYVVILAWVVIGQIKLTHVLQSDTRDNDPDTANAGRPGKSTPVAS